MSTQCLPVYPLTYVKNEAVDIYQIAIVHCSNIIKWQHISVLLVKCWSSPIACLLGLQRISTVSLWDHQCKSNSCRAEFYLGSMAYTYTKTGVSQIVQIIMNIYLSCMFNHHYLTRQHFSVDTFKRIFLNDNCRISLKYSRKCAYRGPINNIPA